MRTSSFIIFFATVFLHTALHGQTARRHILDDRIDSLQSLITKASPDTGKVNLYLQLLGNYYLRYKMRGFHAADSLAFFQTSETARLLSKKLQYAYGEGTCLLKEAKMQGTLRNLPARDEKLQQAFTIFNTAHNEKGLAYAFLSRSDIQPADVPLKIKYCDTAVQLARQCRDLKLEAFALKSRADFHLQQLKDSIAIQELVTALELQKRSGDNTMHYTTDLLTHLYINTGKLKEALECAIASLDYCRKANDTVYVLTFYQRLGDVYRYMKNVKEAFYYYQRALSVMDNSNSLRYLAIYFLSEMGECLNDDGKSQEALDFFLREIKNYPPIDGLSQLIADRAFLDRYFSVNNFKETEKYLLKILGTDKEIGKAYGSLLHVYTIGASLYYQLKQYDKASLYVDTAYTMAMQSGSRTELMKNCLTRYKLALIKEDYKNALKHYEEYKKYSDAYQQEAADRRFIELSVKYETDQKNSQLQFLTTQTKLNEATIKQGTILRNFMIVASVLLLLLLLLIFNRYRVKQRANKQLRDKQDEINWQNQQLEKMVVDEKMITAEKDKLLQEKEWLMKEINHRVKNNLQVVMSLLNTQSAYLQDEAALNAIQESRHRVHAISLIHRKLYQSDQQLTTIDMVTYIKDVTEYLADSLDMQNRITFDLLIDPIELDVTQAVPVGLIINEAVTNAVKYAFPEGRKSRINISMHKKDNGIIDLMIQDNGVGLPPGYDWQQSESLGMSLMQGLSRQLDGQFDLIQQDGISIKITFEPAKSLK